MENRRLNHQIRPNHGVPAHESRPRRLRRSSQLGARIHTGQAVRIEDSYVTSESLYDIALKDLPRDVMECYVREAYRDESPSPNFVEGILSSLPSYDNTSDYFENGGTPEAATVEQHIPGVNDLMSGALGRWDRPLDLPPDDALDCANDINKLVDYMPRAMISGEAIAKIPQVFENPRACARRLGPDFLTTYAGLYRAVLDCRAMIPSPGRISDKLIMAALMLRGGRVDPWSRKVVYPEDMSPIISESYRFYDRDYWTALKALRNSWKSHS